jgi:Transposase zinc-ribbon domain
MVQRPGSLPEFEARFPDDAACARWLFEKRWPQGFRCPGCGHDRGWELGRGTLLVECARCHRQTSVTAGTVLHRSHLPLKLWFLAAWLVATHKNGISARQLWRQLGLGSYKTAWLLLRKLRRAMVDPEREPLAGLVEVDETSIPFRGKDEPARPRARRQAPDRGRGRDRRQGPGAGPAGGDRGLFGRHAQRLCRGQRRRGQHRRQ